MNQPTEEYTPTPADEALYAHLLSTQVVGAIQQAYVDGKIADLETYNKLFEAARKADAQIYKLVGLLDAEKAHLMAEAFRKAAHSHGDQEKQRE